jgi:hypothetical protein
VEKPVIVPDKNPGLSLGAFLDAEYKKADDVKRTLALFGDRVSFWENRRFSLGFPRDDSKRQRNLSTRKGERRILCSWRIYRKTRFFGGPDSISSSINSMFTKTPARNSHKNIHRREQKSSAKNQIMLGCSKIIVAFFQIFIHCL